MSTPIEAKATTTRPSDTDIWRWLAEIPDPEIPVISVVDLGIVRGIDWEGDTLVVTVTPTYSGCPATRVINNEIVAHLRAQGVHSVRTKRQLSPAWTTAWLSTSGREKLREYGIAPPVEDGPGCAVARTTTETQPVQMVSSVNTNLSPMASPNVVCPRCGKDNAERVSQYGSTPCKASYRCRGCLEPFDYFKCH